MSGEIDVEDLAFDDENEAEMARHGVVPREVDQIHQNAPQYFRNKSDARGSHVMMGPTDSGRMHLVPLERCGSSRTWRPITAFEPTPHQRARYRSHP